MADALNYGNTVDIFISNFMFRQLTDWTAFYLFKNVFRN